MIQRTATGAAGVASGDHFVCRPIETNMPDSTAIDAPGQDKAADFSALWHWQRLRRLTMGTHRSLATAWALSVLEEARDRLFIDTETTGLSRNDQVIELAVAVPVRQQGRWRLEPVLIQRMRPSVPIDPGASMVHGIYAHHLQDAPTFLELAARIRSVMHGRRLLAWNAPSIEPRSIGRQPAGRLHRLLRIAISTARCARARSGQATAAGACSIAGTSSAATTARWATCRPCSIASSRWPKALREFDAATRPRTSFTRAQQLPRDCASCGGER